MRISAGFVCGAYAAQTVMPQSKSTSRARCKCVRHSGKRAQTRIGRQIMHIALWGVIWHTWRRGAGRLRPVVDGWRARLGLGAAGLGVVAPVGCWPVCVSRRGCGHAANCAPACATSPSRPWLNPGRCPRRAGRSHRGALTTKRAALCRVLAACASTISRCPSRRRTSAKVIQDARQGAGARTRPEKKSLPSPSAASRKWAPCKPASA